ncbi:MAG: hypothetical protein ACK5IJ_10585 [Mangrovibacterium sp.]
MRKLVEKKIAIYLIGITTMMSCTGKINHSPVVAQVYKAQLHSSDLLSYYPKGLSSVDSVQWAKSFIESWVKSELMLHEAEKELSSSDLDVDQLLHEYRKSLLIYKYEQRFLKDIDTLITSADIRNMYPDYELAINDTTQLVRGVYMKFVWEKVDINTLNNLTKNKNYAEITNYGRNNANEMADYSAEWVNLKQLLAYMPENSIEGEPNFSNKSYIDSSDTEYYYFLCVYKFDKAKKYSNNHNKLEEEDIRNAILYKRKQEYSKKIKKEIFEEAEANKNITIY